jgi:predicted DNA-binding WGR domain protein
MWRWVNPEKHRYYQADLVLDLFGDWSLVWAWGGLGSNRGRVRMTSVPSREAGLERIREIDERRRRRGYRSTAG